MLGTLPTIKIHAGYRHAKDAARIMGRITNAPLLEYFSDVELYDARVRTLTHARRKLGLPEFN